MSLGTSLTLEPRWTVVVSSPTGPSVPDDTASASAERLPSPPNTAGLLLLHRSSVHEEIEVRLTCRTFDQSLAAHPIAWVRFHDIATLRTSHMFAHTLSYGLKASKDSHPVCWRCAQSERRIDSYLSRSSPSRHSSDDTELSGRDSGCVDRLPASTGEISKVRILKRTVGDSHCHVRVNTL